MNAKLWLLALVPLVLLAGLLALIFAFDPTAAIRGEAPPLEVLSFQRVVLGPEGIRVTVLNDGPDPVRIAQVMVDEAFWTFTAEPDRELRHLARATLEIPYPWVAGELHELRVVTATGITFDHTIEVAVATPKPSGRFLGVFTLIGLYVGVLPVALGLAWYPLVHRLGRRGLDFALALTVGLLLFLLVDATHDGLEAAAGMPESYQGVVLFVAAAGFAYLGIELLGARLRRSGAAADAAWATAFLVAVGIGLHNFAEGLAIGAAFALGEAALGTLLIVGFTLHNTTEGLAIVAPLAGARAAREARPAGPTGRERLPLARLALLGLVAGAPTIAGAWLGGFVYSPLWSVLFLAVGAGAIAQVVAQIARGMARQRPLGDLVRSAPVAGGLLAGLAVMYATGMLIG
ncbi:MAG TPA: metal transporter [Thermoanaerobaculia bacterium]|nr:metal transporter [Thermoanaerobaculia bacterium]